MIKHSFKNYMCRFFRICVLKKADMKCTPEVAYEKKIFQKANVHMVSCIDGNSPWFVLLAILSTEEIRIKLKTLQH